MEQAATKNNKTQESGVDKKKTEKEKSLKEENEKKNQQDTKTKTKKKKRNIFKRTKHAMGKTASRFKNIPKYIKSHPMVKSGSQWSRKRAQVSHYA